MSKVQVMLINEELRKYRDGERRKITLATSTAAETSSWVEFVKELEGSSAVVWC